MDAMSDAIISAIDVRIAGLVGISRHEDDSFSMQDRWTMDFFDTLAHDTNLNPRRVATVLMYLNGGSDTPSHTATVSPKGAMDDSMLNAEATLTGGDTVFPCLVSDEVPPSTMAMFAESCLDYEADFHRGERIQPLQPDPCDVVGEVAGIRVGVRTAPNRGTALLIRQNEDADATQPLPELWHKTCHVKNGTRRVLISYKARRVRDGDVDAEYREFWAPP